MTHNIDAKLSQKTQDYTFASHFASEVLFSELNKVTVPILVVVGNGDFCCPKTTQADRVVKEILNSTGIVIKNAGYLSW